MTVDAWLTLVVVVGTIVVLAKELIPPAIAVLSATVLLLFLGVIDGEQALSGFSNEAPFIVGALLVLARAVDVSGVLQPVVARLFGSSSGKPLLARLLFPVTFFSGFLNNTTVVAMMVAPVMELSNRRRMAASRFLIPVSYAAVLGGVLTAIGTSTNLTVIGLMRESGLEPIRLFELTPIGLPIAIAGTAVMVLLAQRLLPDRGSSRDTIGDEVREFSVAMTVEPGGALDGVSVEGGGLRHLQGVYLAQIERGDTVIAPVAPEEPLRGGDVLLFVGRVTDIVDLQRQRGLVSTEHHHLSRLDGAGHGFFEAVVGSESALMGRTIKEIGFRGRYRAAVLAVHRAGSRLDEKIGDIRLRVGDTLLILGEDDFRQRWGDSRDFLVVAPLQGIPPTQPRKAAFVTLTIAAFVILTAFEIVPLLTVSLAVAFALVAGRVLTLRQARNALDLDILVLIAAAFGLGAAVDTSGLGAVLGELIVDGMAPLGAIGALAGVLIATMALTELVSNNAAAALMFPVALSTGAALGVDVRPFIIAITLGASLSFLTPIGYQTNLLVYGLGNYRFFDYTRLGIPVNLVTVFLCLLLIPRIWPF
ncbi:MAG TPA: SLC13 family permease [Egibacteraceae bacterium]|nr:SLC13 family permease [Egibacteraceae bacterium]